MEFVSLNSGSNGNAYYVGTANGGMLIDAGLSAKATLERLHTAGLEMDQVHALVISHEHSDHLYGVKALSGRYKLPVYCSAGIS